MAAQGFKQSIKSSNKGKYPVPVQLSKTEETPSNQPSEIEAMSRTIVTEAERFSHIEESESEAAKQPDTDLEKVLKVPYLRSLATSLVKAGCRRVEHESEWGEAETAAAKNSFIARLLDKAKRMQVYFPEGWDDCKNEVSREDEGSPAYEWEDFDTHSLEPVKGADGYEWEEVGVYLSPITAIAVRAAETDKPRADAKDQEEWASSAIHPDITYLSLMTLRVATDIQVKLNNFQVNFKSGWVTTPRSIAKKGEKAYAKILPGFEFKPHEPRQAVDEEGNLERNKDGTPKLKKYEQPVAREIGGEKVTIGACFHRLPLWGQYDKAGKPLEDKTHWYRVKDDVQTPIWITEGGKKACSIMSVLEGKYPAIALIGVWGWCKPQTDKEKAAKKPKELRPELTQVNWKGRTVFICFDSDKWDSTKTVRQAELALAKALTRLGAIVRLIDLGSEAAITRRKAAGSLEEGKVGIDDHRVILNEGFDCDDEFVRLMDESEIYKAPKVIEVQPSGQGGQAAALTLERGETIEVGVSRLWLSEVEPNEGWVVRYSDGCWYEQVAPRSFKLLANGEADVRAKVQDLLKKLKVRRKVEGEAEVNKEAEAKWEIVKAKAGTTKNIYACLPWLKSDLKTTFEYDPKHLTFADGQVMELSTGELIDGSALPPTLHALPFVYTPTEFDDLPKAVRELLNDRFTPENLLLARAVLRYAFDRADDSHKKGYAIQLLAESDGGKSVLMQVIKACKPSNDMTAKLANFNGAADSFFLSETIGRGQDVLIADDVAFIPKGSAQNLYSLVSDKEKQMKTKNIKHAVPVPRNVCVIFGGTAVVVPSDASNRTGWETRYLPLQLQPLPKDKDAHRERFFAPFRRDAQFAGHAYAIGCWALGMSRAEMLTVLEKAASSPEKKAMLAEETQVGRFIRDCLSPMPTKFGVDCLSFEMEGLALLSCPTYADDHKVKFRRLMAEGGVAESFLWPVYKAWVDEVGRSKHRLSRDTFISELRGLLKDRLKVAGKNEKVWSGKESQRVRDSYMGLWLAGEHNPFLSLFPHLSPDPVLYAEDGKRFNAELMNSI